MTSLEYDYKVAGELEKINTNDLKLIQRKLESYNLIYNKESKKKIIDLYQNHKKNGAHIDSITIKLLSNLFNHPIDIHYWDINNNTLKIIKFNEGIDNKNSIKL